MSALESPPPQALDERRRTTDEISHSCRNDFVFLTAGGSQCTETGLVGCPNPIDVAKGLRNLQQNNWTTISVERVISIWPNRFDELACERKNGCRLLVSKNRVIGGH